MEITWIVTAILGSVVFFIMYWTQRKNNYWKKQGVPYVQVPPVLGTLKDLFLMRKGFNEIYLEIYQKYRGERFVGYFQLTTPSILIRDPDLVNLVLVKDFSHFVDRTPALASVDDLFSRSFNNFGGDEWRRIRNKLTPIFSASKLKTTLGVMKQCSHELVDYLRDKTDRTHDMNDLMQKVIFNITARIAFGLHIDTLNDKDGESAEFLLNSTVFFNPDFSILSKFLVALSMPLFRDVFKYKLTDKKVDAYFRTLTKDIIKHRQETATRQNDFLQLLLDEKEKEKGTDSGKLFNDDFIAAQAFIFVAGGSETVATVLQFVLFRLAMHRDLQKKMLDKISEVLSTNELNYETVIKFTYMDQFINETLRLHPISQTLTRLCTSDYTIPGTNVIIKKGNFVHISAEGLHKDPLYHENPEKFDPERFKDMTAIPKNAFYPFGSGPRMCIGMRLSMLQMKIILAILLSKYSVELDQKTKLPLRYSKNTLLIHAEEGIWLKFHKRDVPD